jgi:hypothetical protein
MLGNTAATAAAVLATKRLSRHARNTKVLLVKLPLLKQLLNHLPLLVPAAELGHIARIFNHSQSVEVGRETKESGKQDIQDWGRRVGSCHHRSEMGLKLLLILKNSPGNTLKA